MEIVSGIHRNDAMTGDKYLFLYVVEMDDGLLVIDSGERHHPAESILPFLETNGWSPAQIRWVINTHADVDHFGGNHDLASAAPEAIFACHNLDRPWIASRERTMKEHYNRYAENCGVAYDDDVQDWLKGAMGPDVPITLGFAGGERLQMTDGRDLLVLHTPGHTPGHLSLWDAMTRTAIVGDAVLGDAVREASGAPQSPPPYYTPQSYLSTIQTLESLAPERLLTCHYPYMEGEAVVEFLAQSRAWVLSCDQTIRDSLREASKPMGLFQLIDAADERLGPYPFKLAFKYTLCGHAERLVDLGLAKRAEVDGYVAWQWQGD